MTTRSLILSPHEIRAALAGTLGLVVRPVRPTVKGCKVGAYHTWKDGVAVVEPVNAQEDGDPWDDIPCPLGVPGDRLVCKETWKLVPASAYATSTDDGVNQIPHRANPGDYGWAVYREGWTRSRPGAWASPATMPAWASRITLEVEGVRCCRLHQLCEDDMRKAYGISMATPASHELYKQLRTSFEAVWDKLYAKHGIGWDGDPWVWAVNVRRVEP